MFKNLKVNTANLFECISNFGKSESIKLIEELLIQNKNVFSIFINKDNIYSIYLTQDIGFYDSNLVINEVEYKIGFNYGH